MIYDFVEGTTDALQFQLLEGGVPIDLTGITVTALIEDCNGSTSSLGTVSTPNSALGEVKFTPTNASSFSATLSPYFVRWKLTTNSSGLISYIPSTARDVWNVVGL